MHEGIRGRVPTNMNGDGAECAFNEVHSRIDLLPAIACAITVPVWPLVLCCVLQEGGEYDPDAP